MKPRLHKISRVVVAILLSATILFPAKYRANLALRWQLDPQTVDRFQFQYRALYAVIGLAMLGALFFR